MEDIHVSHLAGVVDGIGDIKAIISKRHDRAIGHTFEPAVVITRPRDDELLLGKLDAYCEDERVKYNFRTSEQDGDNMATFEIRQTGSIRRFLEPLMPYLTSNYEYAALMLDEIIPRVEDDAHLNKDGFYELVGFAEKLRERTTHGPESKYTQEYFESEWGIET